MKTFKSFAYLMAIAIVGVAVSSCKQKEEVENTGYNPDRETVKTQFAINLPQSTTGTMKKMKDAQVNANGSYANFNGIECMRIIPYASATDFSTPNANLINLSSDIAKTDLNNKTQSKIYNDVLMPTGTKGLLFYGLAKSEASPISDFNVSGMTDVQKHTYGALEVNDNIKTNPFNTAGLVFNPMAIGALKTDGNAAAILTYLNSVAGAKADASNVWATTTEIRMSELYNQFTKGTVDVANKGLRNGSGRNVEAMMNELYLEIAKLVINDLAGTTTYADLKTAILAAINNSTYVATPAAYTSGDALATKLVLKDEYRLYPENLAKSMPGGAAAILWNESTKAFEYVTESYGAGDGAIAVADWTKYVYPASLYYFAKGGVKASDAADVAKTFNGTSTQTNYDNNQWSNLLGEYTGDEVLTTTRSIAMVDQVDYAVGRLDLAVRALNNEVATREDAVKLNFNNITLTGVLISGLNDVGYDFTPLTTARDYIYYDNVIDNQKVNINSATPWAPAIGSTTDGLKFNNYTLVLESKDATALNICLEFLNNDKDFHGKDNQLIAQGTKFYLIGRLDPAQATNDHSKTKVFVQDHKTIARITIGDVTGEKAYNTIPDLKVPELEFALSVDLEWQQGMEFNLTW